MLKNLLKKILFKKSNLEKYFFDYSNFQQNTLSYYFKERNSYNDNIKIIYDIGAHKGDWAKQIKKVFSKSSFYLFEANKVHLKNLKKIEKNSFIVLLSNKSEKKTFYALNKTGDSYLKQKTGYDQSRSQEINSITLDEFVSQNSIPLPDFIKLDTQGSELDILNGSQNILKNCKFILIELPILNLNLNAPLFQKYLEFMNIHNFAPVELIEKHIHNNMLVQIDLLFEKK